MRRNLPILMAIAIVVASGFVHAFWTNRWGTSEELQLAAERLKDVPLKFGEWTGVEEEFDVKEYARAGIVGGQFRRYQNSRTGAVVSTLIVCGQPGPISVHRPEICYAGAGYDQLAATDQTTVDQGPGTEPGGFFWLRMKKQNTVIPEFLGIHYAWSPSGDWQAPDRDPRLVFGSEPFLYKLYVVLPLGTPEGKPEAKMARGFLSEFVPELRQALFAARAKAAN